MVWLFLEMNGQELASKVQPVPRAERRAGADSGEDKEGSGDDDALEPAPDDPTDDKDAAFTFDHCRLPSDSVHMRELIDKLQHCCDRKDTWEHGLFSFGTAVALDWSDGFTHNAGVADLEAHDANSRDYEIKCTLSELPIA